ncbi:hypothetical protein BLNAU_15384 [Blattamonas nauphoetae]|uniref:Uncharacterized protein n=1 Tax=Blattamonas nauphoetae TaxID=2049346 RepID=A0ABQ9XEJ4_9EUKA|nr:hypothetical protein BLNAU_15384 [Blattamonas nauphoetae]
MTPTHFCGLSSDVGNAMIADADEQTICDRLQPTGNCVVLWVRHSQRNSLLLSFFRRNNLQSIRGVPAGDIWITLTFTVLTFGLSPKHVSFISSKLDAPLIPAIPQPSPLCFVICTWKRYVHT